MVMHQLAVDVPEALYHALLQRAYDESVSVTELVHEAISVLLARNDVFEGLERAGIQLVRDVP
jgi:hypothetical protein